MVHNCPAQPSPAQPSDNFVVGSAQFIFFGVVVKKQIRRYHRPHNPVYLQSLIDWTKTPMTKQPLALFEQKFLMSIAAPSQHV
jgi:hypothetical protein